MTKTKVFASRTDRLTAMNEALDRELSRLSQRAGSSQSALLTEMVQYHLGLRKAGDRPGKRLRANIALLTCEAFGRRYSDALWAAVAVELVHNFSLVFDDVQDGDELRRGRPSVWKVWGVPQAINAGAALEALVPRAVAELMPARHLERLAPALRIVSEAMLRLCRGQVMDLDVIDQGFRLAAAGTLLEGASLELLVEPMMVRCRRCGSRTAAHDALALAACPACGGVDVDVPGDGQVTVESITFASSIPETPVS